MQTVQQPNEKPPTTYARATVRWTMTAKEKLREAIETLSEEEADEALLVG